ncbi:MAG: DUF6524 family protein [Gammaproteobacteria bacterium]|nr:DUF6524 family protein [Gammaproteobacteria bacterium]
MAVKHEKFGWGNYFIRLIAAMALVWITYNPHGLSYVDWVAPVLTGVADFEVPMAFVGVVLLIAWVIFLRATLRSLGVFGTLLAIAFFATLLWLLVTYVPLPQDRTITTYLVLAGLAGVLSAGISWSHVRRRITGQLDVDETDD